MDKKKKMQKSNKDDLEQNVFKQMKLEDSKQS